MLLIASALAAITTSPRKTYWTPSLMANTLTIACIPKGTRVIGPDTPTIFKAKCPKGWEQTNTYYKYYKRAPKQ